MRRLLLPLFLLLALAGTARAQSCGPMPYTFTPGTTIQSAQVNSNFTTLLNCINSVTALNHTSTLSTLKAISTTALTSSSRIVRDGYLAPGDGGFAVYTYSPSDCSQYPGAGDNGAEVKPTSLVGCWNADFAITLNTPFIYGGTDDGTTDAGPAINLCTATTHKNECVIPDTTNGWSVQTTVESKRRLRGLVFNFNNPSSAGPPNVTKFAGSSFFYCSASITPCLRVGGPTANLTTSGEVDTLIVSRVPGSAAAGTVGILWNTGSNVVAHDVAAFNHDVCLKLYATGVNGISADFTNMHPAACKTHYWQFDGWPEARINGGRAGIVGFADYAGAAGSDFVNFTNTACASSGCGPNGITFVNYQFNPGQEGPACALRWSNFTNPTSSTVGASIKLIGTWVEWHANGTGGVCSDATATLIQDFHVDHADFVLGTAGQKAFQLNSATALEQWYVTNSFFGGCTDITLAPAPASGAAFGDVHFSHNFGCGNSSFTSNSSGSDRLYLDNNIWVNLIVAGSWNLLSEAGDNYAALTDTATGNVMWANARSQSWTPELRFNNSAANITYTSRPAVVKRQADGGFEVSFDITLSSIAGAAVGAATIHGMPYVCQSNSANGALTLYHNMVAMVVPTAAMDTVNAGVIILTTPNATDSVAIADANFTNTTELAGRLKCSQAL